jgi:hypothetical protein
VWARSALARHCFLSSRQFISTLHMSMHPLEQWWLQPWRLLTHALVSEEYVHLHFFNQKAVAFYCANFYFIVLENQQKLRNTIFFYLKKMK